jgi:hypothetical protein
VRLDIDDMICACCGGAVRVIGENVREMLDWVPAQLCVIRTTRPKSACRNCETVVQAPAPKRPIAGGLETPALLAQVLVSKYCDHTPLCLRPLETKIPLDTYIPSFGSFGDGRPPQTSNLYCLPSRAGSLQAMLGAVFRFAIATERAERNPTGNLRSLIRRHQRSLRNGALGHSCRLRPVLADPARQHGIA